MDDIEIWANDQYKSKKIAKKILENEQLKSLPDFENVILQKARDITNRIDCLDCANCCKTTVTTFSLEDINKASKFLKISSKAFIKEFLIEDYGEYTTITTPCPFLELDNKCAIYEARPHACNSFPHVEKKQFLNRKNAHSANYVVCPITYRLLNDIEKTISKSNKS
jgi:uncharacterized protein